MARPDLIPTRVDDLGDIQALVKAGFGALGACRYILARVSDPAAARAWLADVRVTTAADLATQQSRVLQVALTAAGLRALGLHAAVVAGFSSEFVGGMAEPARTRRLGDVGASAPERWEWGCGEAEPHLLLILIAEHGALSPWEGEVMDARFTAGFGVVRALDTADFAGREPFGFRDGISQPTIDFGGTRTPGGTEDDDYGNLIAPGEVLLGYRNEYGLLTERPLVPAGAALPPAPDDPGACDLGRNGSYLVFRQLEQDVGGFWQFMASAAPADPVALAEALVGRSRDGAPHAALSPAPVRGVEAGDQAMNGFHYRADGGGHTCPLGAHVRRANPRTGDLPSGRVGPLGQLVALLGFGPGVEADRIAASRFHRLLRRGREYGQPAPEGTPFPAAADPAQPSGIHFICLAANIGRQFEFIQNAWLQSSSFGGLGGEADPLVGNRAPLIDGTPTDGFSQPRVGGASARLDSLPPFVTVKGGAYFFLPGVRALRYLAT